MDLEIQEGQIVYTADGERLGTIKEVVERSGLTYFRVGVPLRRDYWLAAEFASHNEVHDQESRLILTLAKELVDTYKLPEPA